MKRILAIAAAFTLGCTAFAQELTIERLAPENSLFVAGIKNTKETYARWERTTLPKLMELDAIKKSSEEAMEEAPVSDKYEQLLEEILKEMGADEDPSKISPQGAMGLAYYLRTDDEDASRHPAVFVFADFGENAERVQTLIDRMLAEADEDPDVEYDLEEVMGRKVFSFTGPAMDDEAMGEALDEFSPDMDLPIPMPGVQNFFEGMNKVHFTRDGNTFFASSDMQQITDVFEMIDKKTGTALADSDSFQGARAMLGDGDGYAMLFMQPFFQMMAEEDPTFAMTQGMVSSFVGDVKAIGMGMRLDGTKAMVEGSLAAYMPNGKSGITMLLDRQTGRAEVPAFIGANTISFSSINLDMAGVGKLLKEFVSGNPMIEANLGEMMPQIEQVIDTMANTLGDRMYSAMTLDRPITVESMGTLFGIVCKDAKAFENGVSELIGQMGFQPRDFLGQRIYGMDPEMAAMMEMPGGGPGLGIGSGYIFMGQQNAIELAMRSTQQADGPTLAGESSYQRAMSALSSDGLVAWGYMDMTQVAEAQLVTMKQQRAETIEWMKEFNPEYAEELANEPDPTKHWNEESFQQLRELIGPASWQLRSTDRGFVTNFYQFKGGDAE